MEKWMYYQKVKLCEKRENKTIKGRAKLKEGSANDTLHLR